MMMSLRGGRFSRRSNLLVVAGIAHLHLRAVQVSSRSAHLPWRAVPGRALLATTCDEMKSLDEESAKILKSIKAML